MKTMPVAALLVVLGLGLPCSAHEAPSHEHAELIPIPAYAPPFGQASAAASLRAAEAFLASLDEATSAQTLFELDVPERAGWSNLPASSVPRAGISVGELSDDQRKLLFDFLASSLKLAARWARGGEVRPPMRRCARFVMLMPPPRRARPVTGSARPRRSH